MTAAFKIVQRRPEREEWDDGRLIQACRDGDQEAWSVLIQRYRRLIYSIPARYGAQPADAADIFQAVCLELYAELPRLRKVESLRSWLISVTAHQAFHWKQRVMKRAKREGAEIEPDGSRAEEPVPPELLEAAEREQVLRDAIRGLPPRCREMIRLLFYEDPPLPYAEVASRLGLATGSIGFIRGRCLKKLERALSSAGFRA
jgi:RNA polymerase sigma factor (sigma-70 family)